MELEIIQVSQESGGRRYSFSASFSEGIHLLTGPDDDAKSLLLHLLTGTKSPERGEIRFLGYDISSLGRAYRNHLAYFSRYPLFPGSFPLSHYLIYTGILQRLEPDQARAKAASLIDTFGLSAYSSLPLEELPEPVQKRTLLVNTLHSEAPILLLDMPFAYAQEEDLSWMLPHLRKIQEKKIILMSVEQESLPGDLPHQIHYLEAGSH